MKIFLGVFLFATMGLSLISLGGMYIIYKKIQDQPQSQPVETVAVEDIF
ncbi:MAG: hypothetical protein ABH846_02670 [Patescibacteria group bacterium]